MCMLCACPSEKMHFFIRYSLEQKGYRCYNPIRKELRVSRDVIFDELASWFLNPSKLQIEEFKEFAKTENVEESQESSDISGPNVCTPSSSRVELWLENPIHDEEGG